MGSHIETFFFVFCAFYNHKRRRFWYEYQENMASYGTTNNPFGSDEPDKIQEARKQVDDVVGIMRENVEKVMERDSKLSDLDDRANQLADSGLQFSRSAKKVKRKYWWENLKMKLIIGGVVVTIVIVIIVVIVVKTGGGGSDDPTTQTPPVTPD